MKEFKEVKEEDLQVVAGGNSTPETKEEEKKNPRRVPEFILLDE